MRYAVTSAVRLRDDGFNLVSLSFPMLCEILVMVLLFLKVKEMP